MRTFLIQILIFCSPFLLAIPIEMEVRKNSYNAKSKYIKDNEQTIELMILGSSQTNKGLNPEKLDFKSAPLANDGSTLNIDYLLFEQYFDQLPNLKMVIFEISYHGLEDRKKQTWNKNHLFCTYYGVNNYGKTPAMSERFLVTSNPKFYLTRYFTPASELEDTEFNEFGFVLNSTSRFGKYEYDEKRIAETSMQEYMEGRHQSIDLENYEMNTSLLDKAIEKCLAKKIKVILLSPPKHHLYNSYMNAEKLARRDLFFEKYKEKEGVYILNYERAYEVETKLFLNEDHLNLDGVEIFTREVNQQLKTISAE